MFLFTVDSCQYYHVTRVLMPNAVAIFRKLPSSRSSGHQHAVAACQKDAARKNSATSGYEIAARSRVQSSRRFGNFAVHAVR